MNLLKPYAFVALCSLLGTLSLTSCDDDITGIGETALPTYDGMTIAQAVYNVNTETYLPDSILLNSTQGNLGRLIDPKTNISTTSHYVAQCAVLDGFGLPKQELMKRSHTGQIEADSVSLVLNFKSYQGDSLAVMRLGVYELLRSNPLNETANYYSNIDLSKYVDTTSMANREVAYTLRDLTRPDSLWSNSKYYNTVRITLPKAYGTAILNKYYTHPEYFANSYNFIRQVVPGFYFKVLDGVGAMMHVEHVSLNVYFGYHTAEKPDSLIAGVTTFAGTQEVMQFTQSTNEGDLDAVSTATDYTLVKAPGVAFTAVSLPVDSVFLGHEADSITTATLSLPCLSEPSTAITPPTALLMLREQDYIEFFKKRQVPNNLTSYLAAYNKEVNAYVYANIANLISTLRSDYKAIGITKADTEAQRLAKRIAYEAQHPNWNKVYLVPVDAVYGTNGTAGGVQTLLSVRHASTVSSARLLRGNNNNAITLSVVYGAYR